MDAKSNWTSSADKSNGYVKNILSLGFGKKLNKYEKQINLII